jgi:hypothetical protein
VLVEARRNDAGLKASTTRRSAAVHGGERGHQ